MKLRKTRIFRGDRVIWVVFFLLSVISLVSVFSSVGLEARTVGHRTEGQMLLKHLGFVLATYVAIIVLSQFKYRFFYKVSKLGYLFALVLVIVAFALGKMHPDSVGSGEARWLAFGGAQFQPSELVKVLLVLFTASILAKNRDFVADKYFFLILLGAIVAVVGFVAPENFSSGALIFIGCYIMLYLGGVNRKLWWALFLAGALAVVLYMGINYNRWVDYKEKLDSGVVEQVDRNPGRGLTWGHRIHSWLNPDTEEVSQENEARMAIARGGFFGKHVGSTIHGRLMRGAHNDFIYAVIIEETGMLGGILVFVLYAVFFLRCVRIAKRCDGEFGGLLVAGMGTMIYIQALVNMGVAVGALPVTGQTLPFISLGGSAYLFLGCGVGLIQAVAAETDTGRHSKKAPVAVAEEPEQSIDDETENNN